MFEARIQVTVYVGLCTDDPYMASRSLLITSDFYGMLIGIQNGTTKHKIITKSYEIPNEVIFNTIQCLTGNAY